jgi:hypothetical protein
LEPAAGTDSYYVSFNFSFSMAALSVFADLQNVFQEYRIRGVRLSIQMMNSPTGIVAQSAPPPGSVIYSQVPEVLLVQNDTGSRLPTTPINALQYQGLQRFMLNDNRPHVFQAVPRMAILIQGASATEFAIPNNNRDLWVNFAASPDVPHYAWAGIVQNWPSVNSGNNMLMRLQAELLFDCRRSY